MNPPGSRFCNYCGNDLNFSIQPDGLLPEGAVLRGSYVIENVIGEGGMGVVYSCHHRSLGTRYALKVLDPKLARMDIIRKRFLAEAKIQATVRHPHIVHVLDVIDSDKDGGIPGVLAIVMDYVEGEPLDQRLENGPLSEHDAVSCALVVLDAIGFAHHSGIVHRDLKPQNIMISASDASEALYRGVKVMDFGIAKVLQENEQRTVTGAHMGTPRYMAPEQIENARDVDGRADLYAIGLTLYELLTGRTPFEEYREFELIKAQMSMKPPSMRNFRNDISDRLEAIVMKSLEKDRNNRYPNAESFQRALLSLGGYDDIALKLNPYDGSPVLPTNDKLQKKIERAIAKSNGNADAKGEKAEKNSKSRASVASRQVAKDIAAQVVASASQGDRQPQESVASGNTQMGVALKESDKKSRVAKNGTDIGRVSAKNQAVDNGKGKKSEVAQNERASEQSDANVDAFAATQSDGNIRVGSLKEVIRASRDKNKKEVGRSSSGQLKIKRSTGRLSSAHRHSVADVAVEKKEKQEDVIASQPAKAESSKTQKSTSSPKNKKAPAQVKKQEKAAENPVVQQDKSRAALKLVGIIIVLLIIAGFIYRYKQDMPVPALPAVEAQNVENTDSNDKTVDDVSTVPVREVGTEFGRMTAVPAARHWVSAGKKDELRQVELPAFMIDQLEVSVYQYERCVSAGKCPPLGHVFVDVNMPVTNVGFGSAEAYCAFAGKSLPTAEQWEAAARFGGKTNGITHVNVNCNDIHFGSTGECKKVNANQPESVFKRVQSANPGHILNMLGNVREWTSTPDARDPQKRVVKGGSYRSDRSDINISASQSVGMNAGAEDVGFRCVK